MSKEHGTYQLRTENIVRQWASQYVCSFFLEGASAVEFIVELAVDVLRQKSQIYP